MKRLSWGLSAIFLFLCLASVKGQDKRVHTKTLLEGTSSPKAQIDDVSWIQGHWIGTGLGGNTEEIWSPPSAGAMMGTFRLTNDDEVSFYEFCLIREVEESLVMQIKHFDSAMVGWEAKDESVTFPLVEYNDQEAYFDGLTFKKVGTDSLSIYVVIEEDSTTSEYGFHFKRAGS